MMCAKFGRRDSIRTNDPHDLEAEIWGLSGRSWSDVLPMKTRFLLPLPRKPRKLPSGFLAASSLNRVQPTLPSF